MGTHPIFESDFDCLTELIRKTSTMVIDSNSILSRVPPPGAVPVSLSEAAHMWTNQIAQRAVSLVGMVVKIKAPNQSKSEPKKWSTTLWIQDPSISAATNLKWGFELTVWATSDSIHRLPRAEPGEILVAHPVLLTGSYAGSVGCDSIDERMVVVLPRGAKAKDPRAAPGSVLPTESNDLKWSPENKHVQRLYISTLLEKLEYLVENWSEESGGGGGAASGGGNGGGGQKEPNMKGVLFPTRRTEDIGRLNSHTVINIEGLVTRVRAIQKAGKSLDDDDAVSALIVDLWGGSGRSPDNAILERRPNQEIGEEAVCWGQRAIQPHSWRPFLKTVPLILTGAAIKSAMGQQVITGTYIRAFCVEICDQSILPGPWSIHRGTPRNRPKCVLSCTGDAPEGASSGIQILPSSFDRACHLSKLFLDRSLLWLGIQQAVQQPNQEKMRYHESNGICQQ